MKVNSPLEASEQTNTTKTVEETDQQVGTQIEEQPTGTSEVVDTIPPIDQEKEDIETQRAELAEREKVLLQKELSFDAARMLEEKGLSKKLVPYIIGDSNEMTAQRVEEFKPIFDAAVQQVVEERLKGNSPTIGTSSSSIKSNKGEAIARLIQNTINGGS